MSKKTNTSPWSIYFQPDAYNMSGEKLMGRQAAGFSYVKGVAQEGFDSISFYTKDISDRKKVANLVQPLLKKKTDINWVSWNEPNKSEEYGGIFFPEPKIGIQSLFRSKFGHDSYSLVGITHTTASEAVMDAVSDFLVKPIRPWDALICTSQCVKSTLNIILDNQKEFLVSELESKKFNEPMLPVIPLGINNDEFIYNEELRINARKELNVDEEDIVLIFVGRLSFHAKSHHYPMFHALNELAKEYEGIKKIHLVLTGWFGNDNVKKVFMDEHKLIAPYLNLHLGDGRDQSIKHKTLAAADIFISLSDNIQETFGLTPLEAMSAGLPVIVSDWNGYRETVRDKIDGFMIPTRTIEKGNGEDIINNYRKGVYTYDYYIGFLSQVISVDIQKLILGLRELINNKNLRIQMGKKGQERARNSFSWTSVLTQYSNLKDELNNIRLSDSNKNNRHSTQHGHNIDPFTLFESYPTNTLNKKNKINKEVNNINLSLDKIMNLQSVDFIFKGDYRLFDKDNIMLVWDNIGQDYISIDDLQEIVKLDIKNVLRIVMWLHKFGLINIR